MILMLNIITTITLLLLIATLLLSNPKFHQFSLDGIEASTDVGDDDTLVDNPKDFGYVDFVVEVVVCNFSRANKHCKIIVSRIAKNSEAGRCTAGNFANDDLIKVVVVAVADCDGDERLTGSFMPIAVVVNERSQLTAVPFNQSQRMFC